MLRRRLLLGTTATIALATGLDAAPIGGIVLPTGGGAGPTRNLATLSLVNFSGSAQGANFVSPIFGWPFKKGDVPTGTAPQFLISGVAQPFSWGCQAYWSDGSLKFASFMLRSDTGVAGGQTLSIQVWNGGAAPTTSARTLTEVYAQSIKVNAVAAPITLSGNNISGTWSAWLDSAANTNNNNLEQYVYLDGDAGKVWRVMSNLSTTKTGAAHGQLVCYHYIAALTNSSGTLGGFRYLPCLAMPYYDVNSPAKYWKACSDLNFQYGAGPTTVHFPFPFTASAVTGVPGAGKFDNGWFSASSAAVTNWALGTDPQPVVPGYLTGSLPTVSGQSIDTDTMYFAMSIPGTSRLNIDHTANDWGNTSNAIIPTSAGSATFNPCYIIQQFCRVYGATVSATWNFFQGTGSLTTDNTVRTKIDQTYWHSSKMVPPFDLSLIGTITDNTSVQNYNTQAVGPVISYFGQTGDREDLGPFSAYSARHFYNQTALSEQQTRLIGLSSGHLCFNFLNSANRLIPNLTSATYTGMTSANTLRYINATGHDFTVPPGYTNVYSSAATDHLPELIAWAYAFTGEPQNLDMLIETGNGAILVLDETLRNPTLPAALQGVCSGFEDQERSLAWATRNINLAGGFAPLTMPDGSLVATYIRDRAAATNKHITDIWNSTTLNSYCTTTGFWTYTNPGAMAMIQSGWQRAYVVSATCMGASMLEDANALTALSSIFAAWYSHGIATFGGWAMASYYEVTGTADGDGNNHTYPIITNDAHWAPRLNPEDGGPVLAWTISPTTWTVSGTHLAGWTPADNDKFIIFNSGFPALGVPTYTPYYAWNTSGLTFKLRTAPSGGGSAVNASAGGSGLGSDGCGLVPVADIPGQMSFSNTSLANQLVGIGYWGKAILGTSVFDTLITDMTTRLVQSSNTNPQWAMQGTF